MKGSVKTISDNSLAARHRWPAAMPPDLLLFFCVLVAFIASTFVPGSDVHALADVRLFSVPTWAELLSCGLFFGVIVAWLPYAARKRSNATTGIWIAVVALLGSFLVQFARVGLL
jgi:hypothetical protein